jgi:hypothetical protein
MEYTAALLLYVRCFLASLSAPRSEEALVFSCLVREHSYRLQKNAHSDIFIALRYLKKSLKLIWAKPLTRRFDGEGNAAVFDAGASGRKERIDYLEAITKRRPCGFIHKEDLGTEMPPLYRLVNTFLLLAFSSLLVPISLIHRRRGSLALNLLEIVECANLAHILKKAGISKVYYFCAFNKDANFCSLRLRESGIYSHVVPSSNPIKNFYRTLIADGFSFTAPYQRKEYDSLKENWRVREFFDWPIFRFEILDRQLNQYRTPAKNSLGFISSGIWRRIERGDKALGIGEYESELALIATLKNFLNEHPEISFSIFLHPVEKSNEMLYQRAMEHYRKEFGKNNITFFPRETPTYSLFDQVEVSIAAYSSTNLERLYAGFKTLYAPIGIREDYYSGDSLENISAFNKEEVSLLILREMQNEPSQFFDKNELWPYHYSRYRFSQQRRATG